jgi:hypothetical protein
MGNPAYPLSYQQYICSPSYIKASNKSRPHIKRACLNNDFLLKYHKHTFQKQIDIMALNGFKLTRQSYEKYRKGIESNIKVNWLSYLVIFWEDNFGYEFSTLELMMDSFPDIFEQRILPQRNSRLE